MSAIDDVAAERKRQIEVEGWSAQHDDRHPFGEIASAGIAYAIAGRWKVSAKIARDEKGAGRVWPVLADFWPFDLSWWKPKSQRENLVRAAALLCAEIDKLDRRAAKKNPKEPTC